MWLKEPASFTNGASPCSNSLLPRLFDQSSFVSVSLLSKGVNIRSINASILIHPMVTIHSILSSFDLEDLRLPASLDVPYWSLPMDSLPLHVFSMFPYCGFQAWALPPFLLSCLPRVSHLAPLLDMFIGYKLSNFLCTSEIISLSQKLYSHPMLKLLPPSVYPTIICVTV